MAPTGVDCLHDTDVLNTLQLELAEVLQVLAGLWLRDAADLPLPCMGSGWAETQQNVPNGLFAQLNATFLALSKITQCC